MEELLDKAEELIKSGNLDEAQEILFSINERGARWHYLHGLLSQKKEWINEIKKSYEKAVELEPQNETYKNTLAKLTEKYKFEEPAEEEPQMGDTYKGKCYTKRKKKHKISCNKDDVVNGCCDGCAIGCGEGCGYLCEGLCSGL